MAGASSRRPIPALVFLLALSLLSGLVWWRVLNRDDSSAKSPTTSTSTSTCARPTTKPVATLPKPATVTVDVLNATNTNQLAAKVTALLAARGFKVGVPDTDPTKSALSHIRYGPKSAAAARLLQIYVPGSALTPVTGSSAVIVLSVGTSFKVLNTAAVVAKALAATTHVVVKAC